MLSVLLFCYCAASVNLFVAIAFTIIVVKMWSQYGKGLADHCMQIIILFVCVFIKSYIFLITSLHQWLLLRQTIQKASFCWCLP